MPGRTRSPTLSANCSTMASSIACRLTWTSMAFPRARASRSLISSGPCAGRSCSPGPHWTALDRTPMTMNWRFTRIPRRSRSCPGGLRWHGCRATFVCTVNRGSMCSRTVLAASNRPRREPRTAIQSRHRMRVLPRPRGRQPGHACQSENGHAQGRLRRPRPAREYGLARRDRRLHEPARLERPLLRSRGRQQPVRDRFRVRRLPSRQPIVTSCSA